MTYSCEPASTRVPAGITPSTPSAAVAVTPSEKPRPAAVLDVCALIEPVPSAVSEKIRSLPAASRSALAAEDVSASTRATTSASVTRSMSATSPVPATAEAAEKPVAVSALAVPLTICTLPEVPRIRPVIRVLSEEAVKAV